MILRPVVIIGQQPGEYYQKIWKIREAWVIFKETINYELWKCVSLEYAKINKLGFF